MTKKDVDAQQVLLKARENLRTGLPLRFRDEIEIVGSQEESDPITHAVIDLAMADCLRDLECWDTLNKDEPIKDPERACEINALLARTEFRLAVSTWTLAHDSQTMSDATFSTVEAFRLLIELESEFPDAAERLKGVVEKLLSASYSVVKSATLARHKRQSGHSKSLGKVNKAHHSMIRRAKDMAASHWISDIHKKLTVIDVAKAIRDELIIEGIPAQGLAQPEAIKKWIGPAAPDYARKPGRRK